MTEEQNNTVVETVVENNNIETSSEVENNSIPSDVINNTKTINLNNLREVMEENPLVKRIVNKLVKNYEELSIDELQEIVVSPENQFSRWDIIKAIKKLAELGFLKFISGRKGKVSRVFWHVLTRKLNIASKDNTINELEIIPNQYNSKPLSKVKREKGTTNEHSFILRENFKINFLLPKDIQAEETNRLANYITTLAIPTKILA